MRIITGKNKGRKLETLAGISTRPMTDRMKESVFNVMGPYFEGGIVLDLFGGSGALSLEALSRGCELCYIVELSSEAIKVINKNINFLDEGKNVKIYNIDYQKALRMFSKDNLQFDYVFLDPPYRLKVIDEIIEFLLTNNMICQKGNIICHYLKNNYHPQESDNLKIIKHYNHGSSEVVIYEFNK